MKRDALRLSQQQFIETGRDHNGRYFIAYSSGASLFIREVAELRRFLKVPKGLPMRECLEGWLSGLQEQDSKLQQPRSNGLSPELLATGFGPEVHGLDEADPNFQTRTVI